MRVLVCGGRRYSDVGRVRQVLDTLAAQAPVAVVLHGCAGGADSLAGQWARSRGVPEARFPADWDKHGKGAGPIRNQQMLDEGKPDVVVAFPGGTGTADMTRRARGAGVRVYEIAP